MSTDSTDGGNVELWMLLGRLRGQLWDASRQLDAVQRGFPKDVKVRRASKDVKAALHSAYTLWRAVKDGETIYSPGLSEGPSSDSLVRSEPERYDADDKRHE